MATAGRKHGRSPTGVNLRPTLTGTGRNRITARGRTSGKILHFKMRDEKDRVVLQENMLFNRSVRDNIALADPAMPTERVIAAAKLAGAHDFILELPEGYDTIVGERGTSLSGGQRQRIAIARALIADPRILIFDEATSALDYESERIVQQNMAQIARGRTVFVIAHRLSALRIADRIITIERGRLTEDGSHDDLIKTGGRYATLYRLQAGLHEVR